ncbi:MAG: hypothetical protein AAFU53_13755, partial [Cyanobacteria bacterium J06632_3]
MSELVGFPTLNPPYISPIPPSLYSPMLTHQANAKINLYLEIIGSRPDGFHELVMVMQSVGLSDRITLKPLNAPTINLNCDHPQVPTDHTNLAYQAVTLLQKRFPDRTNRQGG